MQSFSNPRFVDSPLRSHSFASCLIRLERSPPKSHDHARAALNLSRLERDSHTGAIEVT